MTSMAGDGGASGPKGIAKRIKAKGLGRLRWYCQMCEKQCRDENGFKCHTRTRAHEEQLAKFAANPQPFIERFSASFLEGFLSIQRQLYGTNAVNANTVYQDYIRDRDHVHMNSTRWTTLTEFVKELGTMKRCHVEDRDGTWWITYIDRAAADRKLRSDEADRLRIRDEQYAEEALLRRIEKNANGPAEQRSFRAPSLRISEDNPDAVQVVLPLANRDPRARKSRLRVSGIGATDMAAQDVFPEHELTGTEPRLRAKIEDAQGAGPSAVPRSRPPTREPSPSGVPSSGPADRSSSVPDSAMKHTTGQTPDCGNTPPTPNRGSLPHGDAWLSSGLLVKVVGDALRDTPYHGRKGTVEETVDPYTARVRMADTAALLQVDQEDLETVIPKPGGRVRFVLGQRRGQAGTVVRIRENAYEVIVRPDRSADSDMACEYEHVCKVSRASA